VTGEELAWCIFSRRNSRMTVKPWRRGYPEIKKSQPEFANDWEIITGNYK
jgi:hypothetical protein